MTNAELLAKIKAEIEKFYGEYKDKFYQSGDQYNLGLIDGLDMAERVLDSLESGKPVPNDLEEAAKEYAKTTFKKPHSDNPDEEVTIIEPDKYAGFIAGARYEDEQLSEKIAAAYQLGLADNENQMMSEAVEGEIHGDIRSQEEEPYQIWAESDYLPLDEKFKIGDKVRIIIVKED